MLPPVVVNVLKFVSVTPVAFNATVSVFPAALVTTISPYPFVPAGFVKLYVVSFMLYVVFVGVVPIAIPVTLLFIVIV